MTCTANVDEPVLQRIIFQMADNKFLKLNSYLDSPACTQNFHIPIWIIYIYLYYEGDFYIYLYV